MPEEKAAKIAEAADVIVNGYAMLKHDLGVRIVNLDSGNVAVFPIQTRCWRPACPKSSLRLP